MTCKTPVGAEGLHARGNVPALQCGLEGRRQVQETEGSNSYPSSATDSLISVKQFCYKQLREEQLADERRGFESRMEGCTLQQIPLELFCIIASSKLKSSQTNG